MRLEHLRIENLRSHQELELDLAALDHAAIVGPNGAGKSTLLSAISWCLYGEGRADALIRHGASIGAATLTFALAGKRYRVTRGRERGKRSWLHIDTANSADGKLEPTGHHTIAEAQDWLVRELGLDYEAFSASVYAPQGHAGVLAELAPGQRKALLAELIGLDHYEDWRTVAAQRAREASASAAVERRDRSRIQERIDSSQHESVDDLAIAIADINAALGACERSLEAAAARERAVEQLARRKALEVQVGEITAAANRLNDAKRRARELAEADGDVEALRAELALQDEALRKAHVATQTWEGEHRRLSERVDSLYHDQERARSGQAEAQEHRERAAEEGAAVRAKMDRLLEEAVCDRCGQPVAGRHLHQVRRELRAERDQLHASYNDWQKATELLASTLWQASEAAREALAALEAHGERPLAPDEGPRIAAERAVEQAVRREAELQVVQAQVEEAGPYEALRARYVAVREEIDGLPSEVAAGPSIESVRERERGLRAQLQGLQERSRRAQAMHEQLLEWQNDLEALNDVLREHERSAAVHEVLARAFGRDGIPALILDGVVGGIETAANEVLSGLGSGFAVRLATQVEKRDRKGMKETLEILVDTGLAEQPLEELSGGERYRVHIALRLGLARALAERAFDCLLLDEPTDLDEAGMQTLAQTLLAMPERQVIVVSHDQALADAMPQKVTIHRASDVSPSEVVVA
jgi:exonuclease SbcC